MSSHSQTRRTALVVGATGTAGSAILRALADSDDWSIATLHRRPAQHPEGEGGALGAVQALLADLRDATSLKDALSAAPAITHVFFCARLTAPTLDSEIAGNVDALRNLVRALTDAGHPIERVMLMEGSKWYGSHLGRYPVPAIETDTSATPYYYHAQQAMLEGLAENSRITWSALRPHTVLGFARQPQHNILFLLALYAAVCVAHNQPLDFPGTPERFVLPTVATNSNILANAALWAVTSEAAANQAFNINNGDVLRWQTIWPEICAFFSMKPGEPASHKLNATMPAYETVWAKIREKCGLVATAWPSAREWAYADGIFSPARVDIIDTKKIRNAGFDCSADTTQSIIGILRQLRNARLIP